MSETINNISRMKTESHEHRVRKLATEKSFLQIVNHLMLKLSEVSGIDNVAENILISLIDNLGGSNAAIYFRMDSYIYYADVFGIKRKLDYIEDDLVRRVEATQELQLVVHDFEKTLMTTPEFTKAVTWAAPLLVGDELIGILKSEDMLLTSIQIKNYLEPFFRYTALILKNEIANYVKLEKACQEITERKRIEESLYKMNRELRALSSCNEVLLRVDNELALLNEICKIICDVSGYRMAFVGYAEDDPRKSVRPVAWAGFEDGYLATANITWDNSEHGQGTVGTSIKTGKTQVLQKFVDSPRACKLPWWEKALERGYRSCISLPLKNEDGVTFGALTIYSTEPEAFTKEEVHLLEELSGDLAYGIVALRARAKRKLAEDAIYESQQVFRSLVENSPDIIARYDKYCRRTYVNPVYIKTANIEKEKLIDTAPNQVSPLPSNSAKVLEELLKRVINTGVAEAADVIWPQGNETFWYNIYAFPEFDRDNQVVSVMTISRDISNRVNAETALREKTEELDRYFTNALDLLCIADVDGYFHRLNPQWETALGYSIAELKGKCFLEFVHPDDMEKTKCAIAQLANQIEVLNFTNRYKSADNSYRWLEWRAFPSGRLIYAVAHDITERMQVEGEIRGLNQELENRVAERTAALEAANKELEAFTYSVSHDLRAPLRHIDGFIELLKKKTLPNIDQQSLQYMDTISNAAKRMGMLIDDLLAFSRIGRYEISNQHINLNTIVQDIIQELAPDIADRDIRWHIVPLPIIAGDRILMRSVFTNLMANAVKFTRIRECAEIEVGYHEEETEYVFHVKDNGVGFNQEYADRLFGVFLRLHRYDEFEGTGIGLANVRRIITRHGGRTWAEGEIDKGATFYFTLPKQSSY